MAHTGPQGNAEELWLMSERPREASSHRWVFFPEGFRRTAFGRPQASQQASSSSPLSLSEGSLVVSVG